MIFWDWQVRQGVLSEVKSFLEIAPKTDAPVESRTERDRRLVTNRRVHPDAEVDDLRDRLGLRFRMASVENHDADVIFEHLEETYQRFWTHRLRLSPVSH
jgi:hypothetical protein